jgi:hypothetical protein
MTIEGECEGVVSGPEGPEVPDGWTAGVRHRLKIGISEKARLLAGHDRPHRTERSDNEKGRLTH